MAAFDDFNKSFEALGSDAAKKEALQTLKDDHSGLFEFTSRNRTAVWFGVFFVFSLVVLGCLVVIYHSYSVGDTTTTGTGSTATTTTSHPDISAAWAVIAAVVAGVVGILVPSPASSKT